MKTEFKVGMKVDDGIGVGLSTASIMKVLL